MFEFLTEHWQEFSLYTVYVSYVLSLLMLISCYWMVLKPIKHENYDIHKLNFSLPKPNITIRTSQDQSIHWWLPRAIRRKVSPPDDPDSAIVLPSIIL